MRLATIVEAGVSSAALVRDGRVLPLAVRGCGSVREIAGGGEAALTRVRRWAAQQPAAAWRSLGEVVLGPAVPDPGAIYTIGDNYRPEASPGEARAERPLVYGKAASSVAAPGASVAWDRALTANVDAECELGIVIGLPAFSIAPEAAMAHVFGYTCIDDISSRDPWLDGDQWLLGKSMPGFCPVGPVVVTADELDPADLRLGCAIDGRAIQDGRTSRMRFGVAEIVAYLSRHVLLRPGDLIASGTPERLAGPPGPGRRLAAGDVVTAWIEGIGELTTHIG